MSGITLGSSNAGKVDKKGDVMTGALELPAGAINSPSLTFGDNTGLSSPSSKILNISTDGQKRITIDSNGKVIIETTKTPGSVIFIGSDGSLSEKNDKFHWNNSTHSLSINKDSPQANLDVNGNVLVRDDFRIAKDNVDYNIHQSSYETTDDSFYTMNSFSIPLNSVSLIECRLLALRTYGAGLYESMTLIKTIRVKNRAGNVEIGRIQSDFTDRDNSTLNWRVDFSINSSNVELKIKGETLKTVKWHCTSIVQQLFAI